MFYVVCASFLFSPDFVPVCCLYSWRRETSLLYQQQKAVRFYMNTDFKHYVPIIFVCIIPNLLLFKTTLILHISLVERQHAQIVAASADTEAIHRFQELPTASNKSEKLWQLVLAVLNTWNMQLVSTAKRFSVSWYRHDLILALLHLYCQVTTLSLYITALATRFQIKSTKSTEVTVLQWRSNFFYGNLLFSHYFAHYFPTHWMPGVSNLYHALIYDCMFIYIEYVFFRIYFNYLLLSVFQLITLETQQSLKPLKPNHRIWANGSASHSFFIGFKLRHRNNTLKH